MSILSWQENLPRNEQPPEWMWALDDELEEWFEELEAQREAKYGGGSEDYTPPDTQMMSNQLAKGRR